MIKFESTEVAGWEAAIRGMRNPMNSWAKSDSYMSCEKYEKYNEDDNVYLMDKFNIGTNDLELMLKLAKAGSTHAKYRRMIVVYTDITAPLYWWKEFDTYKVGTVSNSCSTMHKITEKEFTLDDFSCEHLVYDNPDELDYYGSELRGVTHYHYLNALNHTIDALNSARDHYLLAKNKPLKDETKHVELMQRYWWQMIQLLPTSYNQRRTIMLSYEVLSKMYHERNPHKLDEWPALCKWIETLPYSEIMAGNTGEI